MDVLIRIYLLILTITFRRFLWKCRGLTRFIIYRVSLLFGSWVRPKIWHLCNSLSYKLLISFKLGLAKRKKYKNSSSKYFIRVRVDGWFILSPSRKDQIFWYLLEINNKFKSKCQKNLFSCLIYYKSLSLTSGLESTKQMKKILRINPKESTLIIFSMKYYKRVCTPTIFPSPIISETMAKAMPLSYAVYLLSTTVPSCLKNTFVFNFFVVWFLLFSGLTYVF